MWASAVCGGCSPGATVCVYVCDSVVYRLRYPAQVGVVYPPYDRTGSVLLSLSATLSDMIGYVLLDGMSMGGS